MISINRVSLIEIKLPLKEPFRMSSGEITDRRILLVNLQDDDGFCGWGECVAGEYPNYNPEIIDIAWSSISQWLVPIILGQSFEHPNKVTQQFGKNIRGHFMAKAALEMAIWELRATRENISLAKLLGGNRKKISTGISLGIQASPENLVKKAKTAYQAGYQKIKIKIKPGLDFNYLEAVRHELGPEAPLMADANNAYHLADTEHLIKLDSLNLMMLEQPLSWDDLADHATLQKQLKTPICLDESIVGLSSVKAMFALKSGLIVNLKPGRVGGFQASKQIHDYCRTRKVPVWCGGMHETGIGRAHNIALASLNNFIFPGDISPSARYWEKDIISPEWTMDGEGQVTVPFDKPGMGVVVNRDRISDLTLRSQVFKKPT